jgi:hypothetical protein
MIFCFIRNMACHDQNGKQSKAPLGHLRAIRLAKHAETSLEHVPSDGKYRTQNGQEPFIGGDPNQAAGLGYA